MESRVDEVGSVTYHVVTTMNAAGWEQHGRRMAQSFVRHWPESASLTIYAEGFEPDVYGVAVRSLPDWVDTFKAEHGRVPERNGMINGRYQYIFDSVKFCHKVGALTDFALSKTDGVVIWLDADTFTHADVTGLWLESLFPQNAYLAWLDRRNSHPECGFVMFRPSHPYHASFMERFRQVYTSGEIFGLPETHDSYVLQYIVTKKVLSGKIPAPASLSGEARNWHHPLCAGPLGQCMDHAKGQRKEQGRSPKVDARGRPEPYWRDAR